MYYRWEQDALYLDCSIQPKSNEDRIVPAVGESLKIRICAAPTDGRTNRHKRLCIKKPLTVPDSLDIAEDTLT